MRLAIPAEIVQLYFPESEIVYDYTTQQHRLETKDGYSIPTVELEKVVDDYGSESMLGCSEDDWPEVQHDSV